MSHIALYRAWRSQTFAEIAGQQHIVKTLQNALSEGRFSHAYLFSGPRGTGKTSVAKILARAVNCEQGPAAEPCNQCEACMKIKEGAIMDVIEIDAASNRGVEEIRDLRDNVKYAPSEVRRKVYIIDEVHMLTTEAFNALLKTLEEPPSHVVFILATTEPHRIPATIHSRCQRFDFRRISLEDQLGRLRHVCEQEGIEIEPEALQYIARLSDGGMRDALSLLDQIVSYAGKTIALEQVLDMTGGMDAEQFAELSALVRDRDVGGALAWADRMMQAGKSPDKVCENLILYFRDLLMIQTVPGAEQSTDRVLDAESFREEAARFERGHLFDLIDILNRYHADMKFAAHPRTLFEVALMKICLPDAPGMATASASPDTAATANAIASGAGVASTGDASTADLLRRIAHLESRLAALEQADAGRGSRGNSDAAGGGRTAAVGSAGPASGAARTASAASSDGGTLSAGRAGRSSRDGADARNADSPGSSARSGAASAGMRPPPKARDAARWISALKQTADRELFSEVCRKWGETLSRVKEAKITVHAWLVNGEPVMAGEDYVLVGFKNTIHRETTEKPANRELIESMMRETFGRPLRLETIMLTEWKRIEGRMGTDPEQSAGSASASDQQRPSSAIDGPLFEAIPVDSIGAGLNDSNDRADPNGAADARASDAKPSAQADAMSALSAPIAPAASESAAPAARAANAATTGATDEASAGNESASAGETDRIPAVGASGREGAARSDATSSSDASSPARASDIASPTSATGSAASAESPSASDSASPASSAPPAGATSPGDASATASSAGAANEASPTSASYSVGTTGPTDEVHIAADENRLPRADSSATTASSPAHADGPSSEPGSDDDVAPWEDPPEKADLYEQDWINEAIRLFGKDLVKVKKEKEDS